MVQLGIPAKLVRRVKACMQNSRCKVKFNSVLSEEFTVNTGVRQGDALSPVLFNIALESVVREILQNEPQGLNIGQGKQISLVAYADYIVVITETEYSLKRTTEILIAAAKKIGLIIIENKTKFMCVSRREHLQNAITVKDLLFERVQNFKYLGVNINSQGDSHEEIHRRIAAGNKCYFSLVQLFRSKILSRKTKIRLYKTLLRPIVLYSCGSWASTKSDENKFMIFERKILRRIFGPKRNDEGGYEIRSNRELNALFNESNIVSILKSQRIRWAGHVWRAEGQLVLTITKWKPNKSRPRGRPRQRWEDRVNEDLRMLGLRNGEELAAHREAWREVAEAAMGLNSLD